MTDSELHVAAGQAIKFTVTAAALHDGSPELPVELIVNGYPVAQQMLKADGTTHDLKVSTSLTESSWVAIRQFPHAHTNPIYVVVANKPPRIMADRAKWCLAGVEQCWKSKQHTYAESEQADAKAAYEHARKLFAELISRTSYRRAESARTTLTC